MKQFTKFFLLIVAAALYITLTSAGHASEATQAQIECTTTIGHLNGYAETILADMEATGGGWFDNLSDSAQADLADYMENKEFTCIESKVRLLRAIDEAHCISDGYDDIYTDYLDALDTLERNGVTF